MEQFARITRMVGSSWIECLRNKKVAVFGLGGVGSYVVEALVRNGIGELVLVDHDIIDITNLNRQLYALHSTIATTHTNARHCYSAKLPTLREMPQNASVYQTDGIAFSWGLSSEIHADRYWKTISAQCL